MADESDSAKLDEILAERKRLEQDFTLGWRIDENPAIATGIIQRAWEHIGFLLELAQDGLKYRHVVEHDPVGLEEIEYMIKSSLEREEETNRGKG